MSASEFRVVWKRDGLSVKERRYARLASAEKLAARLRAATAEEALALRGIDPNETACCNGHECGCEGQTHLEAEEAYRKGLPALEYVSLETRSIGPWTPVPVSAADLLSLLGAAAELLAVASLRGDNDLPHPSASRTPWTARMATAWEELEALTERLAPGSTRFSPKPLDS